MASSDRSPRLGHRLLGGVGGFLAPVTPGGWLTIVGVAIASLAPLRVLVRGFGGGAYPSARTRLWVFRPFWCVQLLVPVLVIAGWTAVRRGLEAAGIRVLVNDATTVTYQGARLWIAGTGDPAGSRFSRDGGGAAAPDTSARCATFRPAR